MAIEESILVTLQNDGLSDGSSVGSTRFDSGDYDKFSDNYIFTDSDLSSYFSSGAAKAVIFDSDLTYAYQVLNASNTFVDGTEFDFLQLDRDIEGVEAGTEIRLANIVSDSSYVLDFDLTASRIDRNGVCCYMQFSDDIEYTSEYINGYSNPSETGAWTSQTVTGITDLLYNRGILNVADATGIRTGAILKIDGYGNPYEVVDVSGSVLTLNGSLPPILMGTVSGTTFEFVSNVATTFSGTTQDYDPSHLHTIATAALTTDIASIEHTHSMVHAHEMIRNTTFKYKSATVLPIANDLIGINGAVYDVISINSATSIIEVNGLFTDLNEDDEIYHFSLPGNSTVSLNLFQTRQRAKISPVINLGEGVYATTITFKTSETGDILETKTYYFARFTQTPSIESLGSNKYRIYIKNLKPGNVHELYFTDGYMKDYFTEQELTDGGTFTATQDPGWESDE